MDNNELASRLEKIIADWRHSKGDGDLLAQAIEELIDELKDED